MIVKKNCFRGRVLQGDGHKARWKSPGGIAWDSNKLGEAVTWCLEPDTRPRAVCSESGEMLFRTTRGWARMERLRQAFEREEAE